MDYLLTKRAPCTVCGLDTFRRTGWFLVIENRWLDRLRILTWHPALATQKNMKNVCCREHLKTLISHWMYQANLRLPPACSSPMPLGSDASAAGMDLGPNAVGRLIGELAVHRESFSREWSGSAAALESILDALITISLDNKSHTLECQLFNPSPESPHGLSLQ